MKTNHGRKDRHQRHKEASSDTGPPRWVHRASGGDALEDRAAALFRTAAVPTALAPHAHARLRSRLIAALRQQPKRHRTWAWQWAVAAAVLFGSGAVIAARGVDRWWTAATERATQAVTPASSVPESRRTRAATRTGRATTEAVPSAAPIAEPLEAPDAPASAPTIDLKTTGAALAPQTSSASEGASRRKPLGGGAIAGPGSRVFRDGGTRAGAGSVAAKSTLGTEARMLNGAIGRLRRDGDAAGALAALDVYDKSFPEGALVAEAGAARADALLMLGRQEDALFALETLSLGQSGRELELRVIRGELRAASDCRRAVADFDQVLASAGSAVGDEPAVLPAPLAERALYARAVCRMRNGQMKDARRDGERYLRQFPSGRFAREARRLSTARAPAD